MPLHRSIPLCSVTYVGDFLPSCTFNYNTSPSKPTAIGNIRYVNRIISSGTFKYSPFDGVIKHQQKLLEVDGKPLYKTLHLKSLYKNVCLIDKSKYKLIQSRVKEINKHNNNFLFSRSISDISKNYELSLIGHDTTIIKNSTYSLVRHMLDINKINYLSLNTFNDCKLINQEKEKSLSGYELLGITKNCDKNVNIMDYPRNININRYKQLGSSNGSLLDKCSFTKSVDKPLGTVDKYQLKDILAIGNLGLNKLNIDKEISLNDVNGLDKFDYCPVIKDQANIDKIYNKFMYRYQNLQISTSKVVKLYTKESVRGLFNDINQNGLNILSNRVLDKSKANLLDKLAQLKINKHKEPLYIDRVDLFHIIKNVNKKYFYKLSQKNMIQDLSNKYLNKIALKNIGKLENTHLSREVLNNIFKLDYRLMDRLNIVNLYKTESILLSNSPTIPVYKNLDYYLDDLGYLLIFNNPDKYVKEDFIRSVSKINHTLYIDVVQRWWWLGSHNPTDPIIIPNKDYKNMIELLSNDNFEYLRYNYHSIEWGSNWGKDFNIPPRRVSIEIMLDVVNIIIMIWHKSTQGWLNVTGREGIQLLMELIYDWYSMNSSTPNTDYYRIYRWVRWEAEKVYFLNLECGLQSIGKLVENLLDYVKYHHFNIVPIWRNPKAMDLERNFNRIATHNDLIKPLDKNKGKRHYPIETQNNKRR